MRLPVAASLTAALAALACSGTSSEPSGKLRIQHQLAASVKLTPGAGTAVSPALEVTGDDRRLASGVRGALDESPFPRRAALSITVATQPGDVTSTGSFTASVSVHAVFPQATIDATLAGPVTYANASREELGHELGRQVVRTLQRQPAAR